MNTRKERLIQWLLAGISTLSILSMAGIVLFLLLDGLPFFKDYPLFDFLFGLGWYPTDEPMEFGILPLIAGSFTVMLLATVIAVPLGVATAIYLAEVAKPGMRRIVKPFVELLAALPSVVIGFFGMVVVAPLPSELFRGRFRPQPAQRRTHAGLHERAHHLLRGRGRHLLRPARTARSLALPRRHQMGNAHPRGAPRRQFRHRYCRHAGDVPLHRRNHGRAHGGRRRGRRPPRCSIPCAPFPPPSLRKWRRPPSTANIISPCSPPASCSSSSRSSSTPPPSASRKSAIPA